MENNYHCYKSVGSIQQTTCEEKREKLERQHTLLLRRNPSSAEVLKNFETLRTQSVRVPSFLLTTVSKSLFSAKTFDQPSISRTLEKEWTGPPLNRASSVTWPKVSSRSNRSRRRSYSFFVLSLMSLIQSSKPNFFLASAFICSAFCW